MEGRWAVKGVAAVVLLVGLFLLRPAPVWGEVRPAVREDWAFQYRTMGTPYAKRDPEDWHTRLYGVNLLANDHDAPTDEPYLLDRHAAFWPEDRDQADVVLRRTRALLAHLAKEHPGRPEWARFRDRLGALGARCAATEPDRTGEDADRMAVYLDLCALRREVVLANPLLAFDDLLFVEVSDAGTILTRPTDAPQYANAHAYPGGGLYVMKAWKSPAARIVDLCAGAKPGNGPYQGRTLSGGSFHSPSLSHDGKTVYFSWGDLAVEPDGCRKEGPGRYSHIFRIGIDGTDLRQLTFGPYNDFDCCELPNGRLAFMSTRREGYDRCIAFRPASFLHSMKRDGSDIVCLSFHETHEWHCSVDNDGMIVYTRWDYVDRHVSSSHGFWRCYPDGRDARAPHGNYYFPVFDPRLPVPAYAAAADLSRDYRPPRWMNTPEVQSSIRAVPGTRGQYVAVASTHGSTLGPLMRIDLARPDDYRHGQITRITQGSYSRWKLWATPCPLSSDLYLANFLDRLYVLDRFGNRELVHHMAAAAERDATLNRVLIDRENRERAKKDLAPVDRLEIYELEGGRRKWRPLWPTPVRARPRPPILPTQTFQSEDRRGAPGHRPATLAVLNVYETDVPLPAGTKVTWLRLVQILPTSSGQYKPVSPGNQGATVSRLPLGIVPVEEDGSVYCEAPIERGLYFQLLDEDGLAVQSMRTLTYVHPGEQLTCIGCHEPYDAAPDPGRVPLALQRSPSPIRAEFAEGVVPPDYAKQIAPIFERTCIACHTKQTKGPATDADIRRYLGGYTERKADGSKGKRHGPWVRWGWKANSGRGFARTTPGHCGALNSRLWEHVCEHAKAFAPEERKRLAWWIDLSCPLEGGYNDYYTEPIDGVRWPIHQDVDPANPLGVERVSVSPPDSVATEAGVARAVHATASLGRGRPDVSTPRAGGTRRDLRKPGREDE